MIDRTANGFLNDPSIWTEEVMYDMAREDGFTLSEEHVKYIKSARDYFDEYQVVPVIRTFAQEHGMDRKAGPLYELFPNGPMKMIAKYGGLPQPTGCV